MSSASVESFDGTRIEYQVRRGSGGVERWLVVANGYGSTHNAWAALFAELGGDRSILIWDYRGMHASGMPADPAALRIEDHCRDLDAVLARVGVRRYVLAGWSVGVQVALERCRQRPDEVEALLLINGAADRVLHRAFGDGPLGRLVAPGVRAARRLVPLVWPPLRPAARWLARRSWATALFDRLGVINGRPETFAPALRSIIELDQAVYLHMALLADEHRIVDWLPNVRVPALVMGGTLDAITPPTVARLAADRIPEATYVEVPGATHYGLMEHPKVYGAHIRRFIADLGVAKW